jgi:hypothetical protein
MTGNETAVTDNGLHGARGRRGRIASERTPALTADARITVVMLRRLLGLILMLALIEAVYVYVVSAGTGSSWPTYMGYYDLLADGLRADHLHLSVEPPPELLAQANPFDPANAQYWLGDVSLYGGHYYLYWGPLPAVFLAGFKSLFRISRPVGDQYLVFCFFSMSAVCSTLIVSRMRSHLFPRIPGYILGASIFACAFGNPVPYLLASGGIYQAAISGGQAFLLLGILFAFDFIPRTADHPTRRRLVATGIAWALALGCRVSLAPAIAVLMAGTIALTEPLCPQGWSYRVKNTVCLATPVIIGCLALLGYNKLRFDAWFNFGVDMQLTTWIFRFSPRHFVANLYTYLFRSPVASCHFPYAIVPYEVETAVAIPRWIPFREGYLTPEPVAGLLIVFPCAWAIPVAVVSAVHRIRRRSSSAGVTRSPRQRSWDRTYVWCAITFTVAATLTIVAPLGLYMATMRYLGDVGYGVALLGVLGMWTLIARARPRRFLRGLATILCVAMCFATIGSGLLLGYQGYTGHFARFNPGLSGRFDQALSVCR